MADDAAHDGEVLDATLLLAGEYLREAADALRQAEREFLVHKRRFDTPYPDRPDLTPWTAGVERTARRCSWANSRIASVLKHFPEAPKEPAICGKCHKPHHEHKFREFMEHVLGMTEEESGDVVRRMFEGETHG